MVIAMIWSTHLHCAAVALLRWRFLTPSALGPFLPREPFRWKISTQAGNTTRFAEPNGPANNFGRGANPLARAAPWCSLALDKAN